MDVALPFDGSSLPGFLEVPENATGLVLFVHGSGSSRLSPRNAEVARYLNSRLLATLLFDLLTPGEAADRANVFDIPLLAGRVERAVRWTAAQPYTSGLPLGLFGASTGAAAALVTAARMPDEIGAVVSRGGRPDLAGEALGKVAAPTLLIVGGRDDVVLDLNEGAAARLQCEHRIAVVPGATHLFEEPGALARVSHLAGEWLERWLGGVGAGTGVDDR